jgi:predicted secreted protein
MPVVLITGRDQGSTKEANRGDWIVILLEENLTTGYQWEMESLDSPVLELLDSDHSPDPGILMGRGGTRIFLFRARSSGSQQTQLRLRRSWEPVDAAIDCFNVNIRVR